MRALGRDGYVSALGEWGPIVDGGAWLTVDGLPVDVVFRDLDRVTCAGALAVAALAAANGRLAARAEWVLNEKRLLRRAGLDGLEPLIAAATAADGDPAAAVAAFADALGVAPLSAR